MISPNTITEQDTKDVKEIQNMPGWHLIIDPIKNGMKLKEISLYSFEFDKDENNAVKKESMARFEKMQLEVCLMKELLRYLEMDTIMSTDAENESIFHGYE